MTMSYRGLHALSNIDEITKTATCANCGEVDIYLYKAAKSKYPTRICVNAHRDRLRKNAKKNYVPVPVKVYAYVPPLEPVVYIPQTQEENRDRRKEDRIARRKPKQEYIDAYKLERGCSRCGYKEKAYALDLHHRDPENKDKKIVEMIRATWQKLHEEIAKCDVLCAICHRIAHHERNWG